MFGHREHFTMNGRIASALVPWQALKTAGKLFLHIVLRRRARPLHSSSAEAILSVYVAERPTS
jgi:hypothetical protein